MPSFAFWKNTKADPSKAPLLSEDAATEEPSIVSSLISKDLDLNPDGEDSGVFLLDDFDLSPQLPRPDRESETESLISSPSAVEQDTLVGEPEQEVQTPVRNYSKKLICIDNDDPPTPPLSQPQYAAWIDEIPIATEEDSKTIQHVQEALPHQPDPIPVPLEQTIDQESPLKQSTSSTTDAITTQSHDRDSGVYISDDESLPPQSRPTSLTLSDFNQRPRNASVSSKHTVSTSTTSRTKRADSTARRLKRPAELNLGTNPVSDPTKPRSELEKRYDLIRNSKTQSKASLRSPTALLQERLNMSTKKERLEEKTHVFTPPRQTINGCWLPGPGAQVDAFTSTSVRARTEARGRPAWWCKVDKLVVFDGVDVGSDGDMKMRTRTSKGLSIARRRGDMETIVIPMDSVHCQEMLNRQEWKYDMRVCKRSVCWDCKERCKWELEQEKLVSEEDTAAKADSNRYRADSVLQDEEHEEEHMMKKDDIELDRPMSPIEAMGGIDERLRE